MKYILTNVTIVLDNEAKKHSFLDSSALFQYAVLAYNNTVRWMALVSGDKQLMRWELWPASVLL